MSSGVSRRNQPSTRHRSTRQHSRDRSSPDEKNGLKDKSQENYNKSVDHSLAKKHQDSPTKKESSRHRGRYHKDSSDSDSELTQRDGLSHHKRKRSRSTKHRLRSSLSRSPFQRRSNDVRHENKRARPVVLGSESRGIGAKTSLGHSRKRSRNHKTSRSPERKCGRSQEQKQKARDDGGHANKKSDAQNKIKSIGEHRPPPSRKRFDVTELTIDERFSHFCKSKPLILDESVSIEIERNIDGDEPFVIPIFQPQEVVVPHRSDEGQKPFDQRKEFLHNQDEEEFAEQRVVAVVRSFSWEPVGEIERHKSRSSNHGSKDATKYHPTLFWKDLGSHLQHRDSVIQVSNVNLERDGMRELESDVTSSGDHAGHKVVRERFDLRKHARTHLQESRCLFPSGDSASRRTVREDRGLRSLHVTNEQPESTNRKRFAEKFHSKVPSSVVRGMRSMRREEEKNVPEELPDFSKRPGKYSYDTWMDRPEMIPKGRSYFEHDNRSEDQPWEFNRNRGRGFTRGGRGGSFGNRRPPRFQNSSFGKQSGAIEPDHWSHDKFEVPEEEMPSSTSEK